MKPARGGWLIGTLLVLLMAAGAAGVLWLRERRAWLRPPAGTASLCIQVLGAGRTELDVRPVQIAAVTAMNAARRYRWDDFSWRSSTAFRPAFIQYYPAHESGIEPEVLWNEFVPAFRRALADVEGAPPCRIAVVDTQGNVVGIDR